MKIFKRNTTEVTDFSRDNIEDIIVNEDLSNDFKELKDINTIATLLISSTELQNKELQNTESILSEFKSNMENLAIDITNVHIKVIDTDKLADSRMLLMFLNNTRVYLEK
ncbi:hypothetical protein CLPUN_03960 [Clostridium puniceum]|uniref:Uncharacterized protein n=1 Tax=Clostridium puniceum TaxID=29367 RepID=A0A1S8TWZ9_9CLOT|nr:hypothetical protein [Clostridium puniceum]OOM82257.1 hypothetical protein CLPUN_03960 [Clostridium puniceum]